MRKIASYLGIHHTPHPQCVSPTRMCLTSPRACDQMDCWSPSCIYARYTLREGPRSALEWLHWQWVHSSCCWSSPCPPIIMKPPQPNTSTLRHYSSSIRLRKHTISSMSDHDIYTAVMDAKKVRSVDVLGCCFHLETHQLHHRNPYLEICWQQHMDYKPPNSYGVWDMGFGVEIPANQLGKCENVCGMLRWLR